MTKPKKRKQETSICLNLYSYENDTSEKYERVQQESNNDGPHKKLRSVKRNTANLRKRTTKQTALLL